MAQAILSDTIDTDDIIILTEDNIGNAPRPSDCTTIEFLFQ